MRLEYRDKQPRGRDQIVRKGDVITDIHNGEPGETWTITGWSEPRHINSTGRVHIHSSLGYDGEYFPSVINTEWRAGDQPLSLQETNVQALRALGWEIVIREADRVCMVIAHPKTAVHTRYCEVHEDGRIVPSSARERGEGGK